MTIVIDIGQIVPLIGSFFAIIGGVLGFARFIKWWWKRPLEPSE